MTSGTQAACQLASLSQGQCPLPECSVPQAIPEAFTGYTASLLRGTEGPVKPG